MVVAMRLITAEGLLITDDVKICGKNKEVIHEPQASVSLMFYHILTSSVIYY